MAAIEKAKKQESSPKAGRKLWNHFMTNIRDWCISRQLWWGQAVSLSFMIRGYSKKPFKKTPNKRASKPKVSRHSIRTKAHKHYYRSRSRPLSDDLVRTFSVASVNNLAEEKPEQYVQEEDVLDTWFSSGLWPFSTLGWPEETEDLKTFYPGAVLETGFDILFFWVARMVMMGTYFMGDAPFKDVYLHAMVRDSQGRKMSKSLGNTIDPLDVIQGIKLDELLAKTKKKKPILCLKKIFTQSSQGSGKRIPRWHPFIRSRWFTLHACKPLGTGRDIKLSIPRVAGYRAFLNKNLERYSFRYDALALWPHRTAQRYESAFIFGRPLDP